MANLVVQWNTLALQVLQATHARPPEASRTLAMMHAAIFDAVNAIAPMYDVYRVRVPVDPGASAETACATAAYDVLIHLYPNESSLLESELVASIASQVNDQSEAGGMTIGAAVANTIMHRRELDHATNTVIYQPQEHPGAWRPTPPEYAPAQAPHWSTVTPFAMAAGAQFRSSGFPSLTSQEYATALNDIMRLGGRDSTLRTEEQTQIAHCWADGAGTVIIWNRIAQQVAHSQQASLVASARLFALLNIACADAVISAWDDKYHFNLWRPITAIREADRDGNPLTMANPLWESLRDTTPEPEYTSAHSAVSSASAHILARFVGSDEYPFTVTAIKPPELMRSFNSFTVAAQEAAESRLYAGLHFAFSTAAGLEKGQRIAEYIWQREMRLHDVNRK